MLRPLLALFTALALSAAANASTYFVVNGKLVSQGKAEDAIRKDPKIKVVKIQANEVELNERTGNFKKSDDIDEEDLLKLLK